MRRLPVKRLATHNAGDRPTPKSEPARRGAILIFAFMALLVVTMLGASLIRTVTLSKQQLQREVLHTQAIWLADSGAARAIARLKAAPDYTGETWSVPADQLTAGRTASVRITVVPQPDHPQQTLITATAEYPHGSPTAIRITKRITVTTQ